MLFHEPPQSFPIPTSMRNSHTSGAFAFARFLVYDPLFESRVAVTHERLSQELEAVVDMQLMEYSSVPKPYSALVPW